MDYADTHSRPTDQPRRTRGTRHPARRDGSRRLLFAAIVVAAVVSGGAGALANTQSTKPGKQPTPTAQPPTAPSTTPAPVDTAPKPSFLDKVLTRNKPHDWTLRFNVHVSAYQSDSRLDPRKPDPKPTGPNRQTTPLQTTLLKFQTAAVVFPVIRESASSVTDDDGVNGELKFDDKVMDKEPAYADEYPAGTRLARWEMQNLEGREADLSVEIPMTCYETVYDEAIAAKAKWPAAWPKVAESTFQKQFKVDHQSAEVKALLKQWTGGKDPKSLPPAELAKFLCKQVVEQVQPSGNGETFSRTAELEGLDLQNASQTLKSRKGSDHDIAIALAAIYRAAGLPCRTVIGYTKQGTKSDKSPFGRGGSSSGELRTWVEFALYDEDADKLVWIPVDVLSIRKSSSKAPSLDRPWKYFGTNDELDDVMPFAFQHHPPTTVVAQGSAAFWGWLTTPQTQQASQSVRFTAITTPKGGKPREPKRPSGTPGRGKEPAPSKKP